MKKFKNKHKGERCFILGNGPSLTDVDFSLLNGEITFGTNGILKNKWDFTPAYYACTNPLAYDRFKQDIETHDGEKFFADTPIFEHADGNKYQISGRFGFQEDLTEPLWEGHTVTYVCLQLAYWMGFTEVVLLGVDHDYGEVEDPNKELVAAGIDKYHFREDYFSDGCKWHAPDLGMSEFAFALANEAYIRDGRTITNCSANTKLKVFPLSSLPRYMHNRFGHITPNIKVSAIVSAYYSDDYDAGLVEDLLAQTLWKKGELEIIVICHEGSWQSITYTDFLSPNFKVITTPDVPGIYEAWNVGAKMARGKYLTNANTDDRHHHEAYEIMSKVLDGNDNLDLIYHNSFVTWTPNTTIEEFTADPNKELVSGASEKGKDGVFIWPRYSKAALNSGCFMGPQPMWRATVHQRYGWFDEQFKSVGDYEMWLRMAEEDNMFNIPIPLGVYLARETGFEMAHPDLSLEEISIVLPMHAKKHKIERTVGNILRISVGNEYSYNSDIIGLRSFLGTIDVDENK